RHGPTIFRLSGNGLGIQLDLVTTTPGSTVNCLFELPQILWIGIGCVNDCSLSITTNYITQIHLLPTICLPRNVTVSPGFICKKGIFNCFRFAANSSAV